MYMTPWGTRGLLYTTSGKMVTSPDAVTVVCQVARKRKNIPRNKSYINNEFRHHRPSRSLYGGYTGNMVDVNLYGSFIFFQVEGSQYLYCAKWQVGTRWSWVIILLVHGLGAIGGEWSQRRSTTASA